MSNWNEKVVVVTGGSAGLGKVIVDEFAGLGAGVVSLARSENPSTENVWHLQADVCDDGSVVNAVKTIIAKHGKIDVWINNVGKSTRVAFESATIGDYQSFMEVNFYSAVRCSFAALPQLKKSSGAIVNIGTLASKTGWRNVGPYAASKHALAGFAHQLRIEGPENVHSLFVCPGPIQRNDAATRYQQQSENMEAGVAAPGAGVKISGTAPTDVAKRIVWALEKRKSELVIPRKARILFAALQLSPKLGDWLLNKFAK